MQSLRIEELLRYAFSGALFFLALTLTHKPGWEKVSEARGLGDATIIVGIVMVAGTLIYTSHRALAYPLLLFPLALSAASLLRYVPFEAAMWIPLKPSQFETALDVWRYRLRRSNESLFAMMADWGAQVHFLYCAGWAILLARLYGSVLAVPASPLAERVALRTAVFLFVAGVVHHVRLIVMIQGYRQAFPEVQPEPETKGGD